MTNTTHSIRNIYLYPSLFSLITVSLFFAWQGNIGINLWDEGYLWYGAQRVMLGEVPILDFMSYDPGRYYWSAAIMTLLDEHGIIGLRGAVAVFQFFGLFAGLVVLARSTHKNRPAILIVASLIFVSWMFPRHKLFDISISMILVLALTETIRSPSLRRYLLLGVCIGIIATFGRNHGVYGFIAGLGAILWIKLNAPNQENSFYLPISLYFIGIFIGFLPIILLSIVHPGFWSAFLDSIIYIIETKSTNIPLPIPWPWSLNYQGLPPLDLIRHILIGLFFISLIISGVIGIFFSFLYKKATICKSPAFIAASLLSIVYSHYAFSRADISHLAQGIFPMLIQFIGLLETQTQKIRWLGLISLFAASTYTTIVYQPGYYCSAQNDCTKTDIQSDEIFISNAARYEVDFLKETVGKYAQGGSFMVVPFWPGSYALLEEKSPVWEIYPLLPRSKSFEAKEIGRLKKNPPHLIILNNSPLDGVDSRRYSRTHPNTYNYIIKHYAKQKETPWGDIYILINTNYLHH